MEIMYSLRVYRVVYGEATTGFGDEEWLALALASLHQAGMGRVSRDRIEAIARGYLGLGVPKDEPTDPVLPADPGDTLPTTLVGWAKHIARATWWALTERCLRCGAPRASLDVNHCAAHLEDDHAHAD